MTAKRKTAKKKSYRAKAKVKRTVRVKARKIQARPWKFSFKGFVKALNLKS